MRTLDLEECAEFLKVNRTTALEMAACGALPGAKVGRAWVFLLDDLVEYLRGLVRAQQQERLSASDKSKPMVIDVVPVISAAIDAPKGRRKAIPKLPELRSQ